MRTVAQTPSLYTQGKTFFPKLQNSEKILEIRKKLKFSFSEFGKNRFDNFTKSMESI